MIERMFDPLLVRATHYNREHVAAPGEPEGLVVLGSRADGFTDSAPCRSAYDL